MVTGTALTAPRFGFSRSGGSRRLRRRFSNLRVPIWRCAYSRRCASSCGRALPPALLTLFVGPPCPSPWIAPSGTPLLLLLRQWEPAALSAYVGDAEKFSGC